MFSLLSKSIRSTVLLMLMIGGTPQEIKEEELTPSELVCRHCGGSRKRSRVTALRGWAFDDDYTDESS